MLPYTGILYKQNANICFKSREAFTLFISTSLSSTMRQTRATHSMELVTNLRCGVGQFRTAQGNIAWQDTPRWQQNMSLSIQQLRKSLKFTTNGSIRSLELRKRGALVSHSERSSRGCKLPKQNTWLCKGLVTPPCLTPVTEKLNFGINYSVKLIFQRTH